MGNQKHAAPNAGAYSKVKTIKEEGNEDVYCLNVPAHGNFVVNEGVVVKNCVDALRYACLTHLFGKPSQRLTPKDIDEMQRRAYSQGPELPRFFRDGDFGMR